MECHTRELYVSRALFPIYQIESHSDVFISHLVHDIDATRIFLSAVISNTSITLFIVHQLYLKVHLSQSCNTIGPDRALYERRAFLR